MNPAEQEQYVQGMALRDASKSAEGQLYHKHVISVFDEVLDKLLAVSATEPGGHDQIVMFACQLQGIRLCLEREGDKISTGLRKGADLMKKARVG